MAYSKSRKSIPRSLVSVQSNRSGLDKAFREKSQRDDEYSFDRLLIMACEKFQCPFTVTVMKEIKQDYYKILKQAKARLKKVSILPARTTDDIDVKHSPKTVVSASSDNSPPERLSAIKVTMLYDPYNTSTLTEILITMAKNVPRSLVKIISLLVPYYPNLSRITISKCGINMNIIYELSKIFDVSTITEVCLDGSPVVGADYTLLLETTKVKYLSLCRCNIQDDTCKLLAAKLHCTGSAKNLLLLNLSSNRITDEGAKHIGNALRSNRRLRYLNLADNHITDCGAGQILDVLIEFPLTCDEIMNSRRSCMEYLKQRNDLYEKYLNQLHNPLCDDLSMVSGKSATPKKKKTSQSNLRSKGSPKRDKQFIKADDYIKTKAEMLTAEVLGPFEHPFYSKNVKTIDGYVHSLGNMTLVYLNLAYNNLSFMSVKKLEKVVKYQNNYRIKGLINVVLEGNNLPISCPEFIALEKLVAMKSINTEKQK